MSTQPSSSSDLNTTQLSGIVEVAQQIAGVAAFIKNEFCRGHLATSMPLYTFMKDSAERLHSYGWPLVRELEPRRAHLPWDLRTMNAPDAFLAMDRLADFFERRAIEVPDPDRDDATLAADLRFLSRYTSMVTASTKEPPISGPLTPPRNPLDGLSVLSRGPFVVGRPQPSSNPIVTPSPGEPGEPGELPVSAIEESNAGGPTEQDTPAHAGSPHDLRPLPGDIDHSNHALKGRRFTKRSWFEDDAHFLELIGDDHKQWVAPAPTEYATISGGEGVFASWHYVDASVLGISAVNAIKLEHPLNAKEVRAIDIDILRFVRLMLYDWVGGHLKRPDRQAEKKSLEIVRRELSDRAWKKKRNKTSAPHTPELTALPPPGVAEGDCHPLCSDAVTQDTCEDVAEPEPFSDHAQPSHTIAVETAEQEPEAEIPASLSDLLAPKPDLRSFRGPEETHVDSVLPKPAPKPATASTGLDGFRCHNASCSYCAETVGLVDDPATVPTAIHRPASSSESIDTIGLGNIARHVHFEDIAQVTDIDPNRVEQEEPIAVHSVRLPELQQADVINGDNLRSLAKAPSKTAVCGIGDMTELLLKSRCAALGLPTQTATKPRAEPASVIAESPMKNDDPEQPGTESLRQQIEDLKNEVTALQQALNEPLPEAAPREPAGSSEKTPRTEEQDKHPLQHLVGSRALSATSSLSGTAGSEAELDEHHDNTPQLHDQAQEEPIYGRWLAPLDGIKATTTSTGSRSIHSISHPTTNHTNHKNQASPNSPTLLAKCRQGASTAARRLNSQLRARKTPTTPPTDPPPPTEEDPPSLAPLTSINLPSASSAPTTLATSLWLGEGWKHAHSRDKACAAPECRDDSNLASLFEGEPEFRGWRGPSSEERASAVAESGLLEGSGSGRESGNPGLRSSRGRGRIEE